MTFNLKGQRLTISQPLVAANTLDFLEADVAASEEWHDLDAIYAHFEKDDQVYDIPVENFKIEKSSHLNPSTGDWLVWLHGTRTAPGGSIVERVTSSVAVLHVVRTGSSDDVFPSMVGLSEIIAAAYARGELVGPQGDPGKPGKDGYTPVKGVDYFDGAPGEKGTPGEVSYLGLPRLHAMARFVNEMNTLASEIGMSDKTVFRTPSGYAAFDATPGHKLGEEFRQNLNSKITAKDLVKLVIRARHDDAVREAMGMYSLTPLVNGEPLVNEKGEAIKAYHGVITGLRTGMWERRPDLPYDDAFWLKTDGTYMDLGDIQSAYPEQSADWFPESIKIIACKGGSLKDDTTNWDDDDRTDGITNMAALLRYKEHTYAVAVVGLDHNDPSTGSDAAQNEDSDAWRAAMYDALRVCSGDAVYPSGTPRINDVLARYGDVGIFCTQLEPGEKMLARAPYAYYNERPLTSFAEDIARAESPEFCFGVNESVQHTAASVTKICCALIASKYLESTRQVTLQEINCIGGSCWRRKVAGNWVNYSGPGDVMSELDLLRVMMLCSDNRYANTLADEIGRRMLVQPRRELGNLLDNSAMMSGWTVSAGSGITIEDGVASWPADAAMEKTYRYVSSFTDIPYSLIKGQPVVIEWEARSDDAEAFNAANGYMAIELDLFNIPRSSINRTLYKTGYYMHTPTSEDRRYLHNDLTSEWKHYSYAIDASPDALSRSTANVDLGVYSDTTCGVRLNFRTAYSVQARNIKMYVTSGDGLNKQLDLAYADINSTAQAPSMAVMRDYVEAELAPVQTQASDAKTAAEGAQVAAGEAKAAAGEVLQQLPEISGKFDDVNGEIARLWANIGAYHDETGYRACPPAARAFRLISIAGTDAGVQSIKILRTGKNIFKWPFDVELRILGEGQNRTISAYPGRRLSSIVPLMPNTAYTASADSTLGGDTFFRVGICEEYPDIDVITSSFYGQRTTSPMLITTKENEHWALLTVSTNETVDRHAQIELGTMQTDYEPYREEIYEITLPAALHTGDKVDVVNGIYVIAGEIYPMPEAGRQIFAALESAPLTDNLYISDADGNALHYVAHYLLPAELATVAYTGSYNDIKDKPTIPPAVTDAKILAVVEAAYPAAEGRAF